jgi:mono/diheme cytochrome c family protein
MKQIRKSAVVIFSIITTGIIVVACSKGGDSPSSGNPPSGNSCASKTIVVNAGTTNAAGCTGGTITATASGSTNFTYNIDGGAFQTSGTFSNVSAGDHTIIAKDGEGCTKSASVTVTASASGPLFAAVKAVIVANCNSCHTGAAAQGGQNFGSDCNIVNAAARIKARAVDGNPSFMPQGGQLNTADKQKITNWLTAGGKYSD